ncbi:MULTISPECIES: metal ABC transporter permease [Limnochorda]|uniref:metal ABC transporter permease n=1 Tax=Limnochorda TaxID=1676651 RepID=UPI0017EE7078|nr:metal ABC transporter permease [Limnochorda pilosa]NMA71487.1 metal ABC transporter permease [Bacillota bacterium]
MTWEALILLLNSPNARWVLAGSLLLGAGCGLLGTFALLRRRSLMGDVLAHAALPGVALGFWVTGAKSVAPLLVGSLVTGLLGAAAVDGITRHSRIKEETAQALVLSVSYGMGVVLLTVLARTGLGGQSGLNRFLIGQAASLVRSDVLVIGGAALAVTLGVLLFFKELKLLAFDPEFGAGLGLPMALMDRLLMGLVVAAVAVGLQAVGVVLVAALLITPAAAARFWTERLERMAILSAAFGGLAGVAGALISLSRPQLPTGPLVVLVATGLLLISMAFGSSRGLVVQRVRQAGIRRRGLAGGTPVRWEGEAS